MRPAYPQCTLPHSVALQAGDLAAGGLWNPSAPDPPAHRLATTPPHARQMRAAVRRAQSFGIPAPPITRAYRDSEPKRLIFSTVWNVTDPVSRSTTLVLVPCFSGAKWDLEALPLIGARNALALQLPENVDSVDEYADFIGNQVADLDDFFWSVIHLVRSLASSSRFADREGFVDWRCRVDLRPIPSRHGRVLRRGPRGLQEGLSTGRERFVSMLSSSRPASTNKLRFLTRSATTNACSWRTPRVHLARQESPLSSTLVC